MTKNLTYKLQLYSGIVGVIVLWIFIGISLFVFTQGLAPLGEALPTIGFHLWIFVVTYLVVKSEMKKREIAA